LTNSGIGEPVMTIDETGSRLAQIVFDRLNGVEVTEEYVREQLCKTCYKGEIQTRLIEHEQRYDPTLAFGAAGDGYYDYQEGPGCRHFLSPICIGGGLCPYYKYSDKPIKRRES
jgi:hypothetical protein